MGCREFLSGFLYDSDKTITIESNIQDRSFGLERSQQKQGMILQCINYYCVDIRIPGAVKMAAIWLIPKDVEKPADGRRKKERNN